MEKKLKKLVNFVVISTNYNEKCVVKSAGSH